MSAEIYWMVLTTLMTAVFWMPYAMEAIMKRGFMTALMDGNGNTAPQALWSVRLKKAHSNAIENLTVFVPVVLALEISGANTALTAQAAAVYFFARLTHYVVYGLGLPAVRTFAFLTGWVCVVIIGLSALGIL